jgi:ATP-binding cassette subfamily B protein
MTVYEFYIALIKYQKKYPLLFAGVLVSNILISLCDSAVPIIVKMFFDFMTGIRDFDSHWTIFALLILNFIIISVAAVYERYASTKLGTNIIRDLRFLILKKIQSTKPDAEGNSEGQIMSTFTSSITTLQVSIVSRIWKYIYYLLLLLFSGITLIYFEFHLAMLIFVFMAALHVIPKYFSKKAEFYLTKAKEGEWNLIETIQEEMTLKKVIRIFLLAEYRQQIFNKILITTKKFTALYEGNLGMVGISAILSTHLMRVITLMAGVFLVEVQHITLMEFTAFYLALNNFIIAISSLSGSHIGASQGAASLAQIEELLDGPEAVAEPVQQIVLPPFSKNIVFNNIFFKYQDDYVLTNINLQIQAGQSVAFVGPSGSGKSTLLKLLLHDINVTQGELLFDGINLNTIYLPSLYKQIGVIYQDSLLFNTTVGKNISMGKLDATQDEIIDAAKQAELHDDLIKLPLGYDALVGNQNQSLSGGQCQRIAIARALIANPDILYLDEATSALDPLNCEAIDRTIDKMAGRRTIISVTHRLNSAMNADQIIVMNQGEIAERGRHEELLEKQGLYYQLWQKQHGVILSDDKKEATFNPLWFKFVPMFSSLSAEILNRIATLFEIETVDENTIIFNEGDRGDKFYVLAVGKVSVSRLNKETNQHERVSTLVDGDFFGELALLSDMPRNATIQTLSICIFMTLTAQRFHKIFIEMPEEMKKTLLEKAAARS